MKSNFLFAVIICLCSSLSSNAQTRPSKGINFFKGSWKEVLAEAKKQQKMVFVDVYTDWCAPCKQMDSEVFTLQQVGELYNSLFISYRLNAEKGEGIKLASQYAVKSYPCYLFLDDAGNVIDRGGDYQPAAAFIALGSRAVAKRNTADNLDELRARYEQGNRQPNFLKTYLAKRTSMKLDNILPFLSHKHLASVNNLKLRYFGDIKDTVRLKSLGYALAAKQMAIPTDTIIKKDLEQFQLIMEPFLSGKKDSLKVPGFQEDKKFAAKQYSQEIASLLYTISSSFLNALEPGDTGLHDALAWATHTYALTPNENTRALCDKLRNRLN